LWATIGWREMRTCEHGFVLSASDCFCIADDPPACLSDMAKLGEGDARWIVRERDDGANVNGWHWSEKNLTPWSEERLRELLVGISAFEEGSKKGKCTIDKLDHMNGEVTVQSRKQKKFPLYELEIKLNWSGEVWDAEGKVVTEAKGSIKIPDLSEETWDDLEMTVVCDDETSAMKPLKEAMRTEGCKRVREQCMLWVKELRESVAAGRDTAAASTKKPAAERVNASYVPAAIESKATKAITIKYSFVLPPPVLFETLLDTNRIRGATASDASMSKEVGGEWLSGWAAFRVQGGANGFAGRDSISTRERRVYARKTKRVTKRLRKSSRVLTPKTKRAQN
jgi:activator of HSP90 ATPase